MKDQTCLVTGANVGIGKVTATELARQGARVVMLCRNAEKAEAARQDIVAQTGNDRVEVILVDFASQAQVRRAAAEFLAKHGQLHVLVNNAGFLAGAERILTPDGIESTLAVNHLGYFLLTGLLMPALRAAASAAAPARVVCVASEGHRFASKAGLADLQQAKDYSGIGAYCLSKLCNIMFANELARRLAEAGLPITANSLHPGGVNSNFGGLAQGWFGWVFKVLKPFFLTVEQGAQTSIYLATAPEVAKVSGQYFSQKKVTTPSATARNPQLARQLWEQSEQLTSFRFEVG
jgi:NAD(P)-dependent dehydrogenase (short-subunit alcohol dehydrogenase family)